ncbi:MAG: metal ABC transporter permease [Gammaproteobacteria bacterium]|nr:MAG: metal ABC transporter permease [Gammaproteobacteria bacterium]
MDTSAIDFSILLPALVAGLLVLATHVPLGMVVLQRGIIFIDLAIAQIAGVGVIFAHILFHEPNTYLVQITAVLSAIAGAVYFRWSERHWPQIQEAIIGVVFVVSACIGLLMLANNPQGSEHLKDLLAGQILWVNNTQLMSAAIIYAVILVIWFGFHNTQTGLMFYILFALAITLSVQLVGVYLVFSSLIIPALAVWRMPSGTRRLWLAYSCGIIAYFAGLMISVWTDWPTGPMIVICLVMTALIFWHGIRFLRLNSTP